MAECKPVFTDLRLTFPEFRHLTWSARNVLATTKQAWPRQTRSRRCTKANGKVYLYSIAEGERLTHIDTLCSDTLSKIQILEWGDSGQYLIAIDDVGQIVLWAAQGCINVWSIIYEGRVGEPVTAFCWLQGKREWGPERREAGRTFKRQPLRGPRVPTSEPAFVVLTRSAKVHVVYQKDYLVFDILSASLPSAGSGASVVDQADISLDIGKRVRVLVRLSTGRIYCHCLLITLATQVATFTESVLIDTTAIVSENDRIRCMAVVDSCHVLLETEGHVSRLILCKTKVDPESKDSATWEVVKSCNLDLATSSMHLLLGGSERGKDHGTIVFLGFPNGTCEQREIKSLDSQTIIECAFQEYFSTRPVRVDEPPDEVTAAIAQDSVVGQTDIASQRPAWASGKPIIDIAVSPNLVDVIVAIGDWGSKAEIDFWPKNDEVVTDGSSVALEKGRAEWSWDSLLQTFAAKFTLSLANERGLDDLVFFLLHIFRTDAAKEEHLQALLSMIYHKYGEVVGVSDYGTCSFLSKGSLAPLRDSMLGLQLSLYRLGDVQPQLYANTLGCIQLRAALNQSYAAFEQPEIAWEFIDGFLQSGDIASLRGANKVPAALILRKECLQSLVSLSLWLSDFCISLLRQLYTVLKLKQKNKDGDSSPHAWEHPTVLPFFLRESSRQDLLSLLIIQVYLEYNIHLRRSMSKQNLELTGYLVELAVTLKRVGLKFLPLAEFLADINTLMANIFKSTEMDSARRLKIESDMLILGTIDKDILTSSLAKLEEGFEARICDICPSDAPVQSVLTANPEDLLAIRLAPSITNLFKADVHIWPLEVILDDIWTSSSNPRQASVRECISGRFPELPPLKKRRVEQIREHMDVVTKSALSDDPIIRQCMQCLQFSRAPEEPTPVVGATEVSLLARGPAMLRNAFSNCCICGGRWRRVINLQR
ncbi:hypothetical protein DFS34DRAFT_651961 [Phlyctochytrium arcticum]|nr:hypothetical protein DFS34DRAFT_651961 [Phlyctochytrium arcticum]